MQMVICTHLIQSIRVLSGYDYICLVDCYSISLYKALYFRVCISLARCFIVLQGLHIRLGIEIMVCVPFMW